MAVPSIYTEYADRVADGEITAGLYVKQACRRYLDWLDRDDLVFCPEKADRVVAFIERLHHYKGRTAGQRFVLSPWQRFVLYHIYGFYWKADPEKRVVRNVYLECARKQGKSMFIAALSLYNLLADGEASAEVYIAANAAKQAQNLYEMAKTLSKQLDPKNRFIQAYRDTLKFKATNSLLRTLSYNPEACDGFNASFYVIDEYHAAQKSDMFDVLKSSQLQRKNPLAFVITTAGHNLFTPCYEMRNTCIEILAGVKTDDTQTAFIFELDEADQWDDPDNWVKSNPNLGVTVELADIATEVNRAKNNDGAMAETKTKTLNIWLQSAESWLGLDVVNRATAKVDLEQYRGLQCYIGIDLAAVSDLTAVSFLFPVDGRYNFKTWYFLPSDSLKEGVNATTYRKYQRNGQLQITPGNVTDYDYILKLVLDTQRDYDLYINGVFYDAWNSTQFAINATTAGLPMQPFSQSVGNFNKPTKEFERAMKSGKVTLDANDITRWCISNVAIKTDFNDNEKPVKGGSKSEKIDGVIAMLTALGGYLDSPQYDNGIV